MTQEISSLMDGELEAREAVSAIKACCASREAAQTWHSYHLIGEVLRGESPGRGRSLDRLMEALAAEPVVLAPHRRVAHGAARIALAIAASIGTIAVVAWIGLQGGPMPGNPVVARATDKAPGPVAAVGLSQVTSPVAASQPPLNVNDYLVVHRQIPAPDFYQPVAASAPAGGR